MPIYEYRCPVCGHVFEEWVKLSEAHGQEPCPKCGELSPRMISHTSFVLKGGGWYVTDYGYRKNAPEDSGAGETKKENARGNADQTRKESVSARDKTTDHDKKTTSSEKNAENSKKDSGSDKTPEHS